ncbi:hypothetical protein SAMN05421837_111280 [Amycolatopsis pretoriensis]|uniref:Uncharacterized protein n=1 Tax=Amycolatopsis pretoriensis TaxID=218821 RepID=A0A1H5RF05_9PSEU|nr:hypothetical protein [Amycolatopsis pretoriensis]SEF36859.1 hypothetical protein SAMN05421837_111280 [Amycolatopsis pretoriensis]
MERAELVQELKTLRKGRGLAGRVDDRVGPYLRSACAVSSDDGQVAIREKVTELISELAAHLPDDLRLAALAAFAICAEARQPLYQDRVRWAASRVDRDPRTVRRRVDEAIVLLAELAWSSSSPVVSPSDRWHTTSLSIACVVDEPLVLERRRIVADQEGLEFLDLAVSLPAGQPAVTVLYGGSLVDRGMETSSRWGYGLELPRPLSRGESWECAVLFRPPSISPYMVSVPRQRCDAFDLRVRFGGAPPAVWALEGAFQRDVSDPGYEGRPEQVDSTGEVHLRFRGLTPGLAYGVRWAVQP